MTNKIHRPIYFMKKLNVAYFGMPKTASSSIRRALGFNYEPRAGKDEINEHTFIFTSVRNPYSRFISLWWFLSTDAENRLGFQGLVTTPLEFIEWLLDGGLIEDQLALCHTQSDWLDVNNIVLDSWITFENLERDFKRLPFYKQGYPDKLPLINPGKSGRQPDETYLSVKPLRDRILEWSAQDFERFCYEK